MKKNYKQGFTLVEILVYLAIFAISATFLVAILNVVLRIQNKQSSANEVNQQIAFINNTIQRMVQEANLIDIPAGTPSNTLILRVSQNSLDPTRIYWQGDAIYLQQANASPFALTDSNVKVTNFSVTKYENLGGPSIVQVDLTLSYNSQNIQNQVVRTAKTAITRISAASFDSSILPSAGNIDIGGPAGSRWRDGYFSGGIDIYGRVGIGGAKSGDNSIKLKTNGDIYVNNSGNGIILKTPNGSNCYRITVTDSGAVTSTPNNPVNCNGF